MGDELYHLLNYCAHSTRKSQQYGPQCESLSGYLGSLKLGRLLLSIYGVLPQTWSIARALSDTAFLRSAYWKISISAGLSRVCWPFDIIHRIYISEHGHNANLHEHHRTHAAYHLCLHGPMLTSSFFCRREIRDRTKAGLS